MADLFSLSATTPQGGMAHGSATAHGQAHASALFRRGIDLRLGFDLEASARGALGDGLSAKVAAGLGAHGGLALQAAIPLDLFGEAGVVARFQAQAAAAAAVSAELELDFEVFRQGVRALLPAPLDELLEVFLDEAELSAGLWARAAFAAEILGEAVLAGTLSPTAPGGAGFSFSLQYAAGLGYGAGSEFIANIGFPDPRRLLERLADRTTRIVLREAEAALATQPEAVRSAAAPAMAALRLLAPLGTRAALRVGAELAAQGGQQREAAATRGVVDALAQQAQGLLLEALGQLAFEQLAHVLAATPALGEIAADATRRQQVRAELVALGDRLSELDSLQPADAAGWLAGVSAVLGPLGRLLDLGVVPAGMAADARRALAVLWSAAVLAERVLAWYDHPARASTELFDATPLVVPADGGFAAVVAEAAGRPAGASLRLVDLVAFLFGVDGLVDDLRAAVPELAAGLDTVQELLGSPPGLVLQELLVDLVAADADRTAALVARLQARVGQLVTGQVLPRVVDPIKAAHPGDEGLRLLLDELVTPALVALPSVVLPRLAALDTEEGALRLREALSAVLLQSVGRITLDAVDVLLEHALSAGQTSLGELAATVEALGEAWGGLAGLLLVAAQAPLPVSVTPAEARVLLELAASVAGAVNQHQREQVLASLRTLVRLGFESAAGRQAALETLLTSDEAPDPAALELALTGVRDGSWEVVKLVAPKALELLVVHYLGVATTIATAVASGTRALVEAVEQGLALVAADVALLLARLGELAGKALELAGEFAGHIAKIAERAQALITHVVEQVRAAGASLLEPLLAPLPNEAKKVLRDLYNTLFDAARALLTLPLSLLGSVATFVKDACTSAATLTPDTVRQELRSRILGSAALDLHFDLEVWVDPPPVAGIDLPPVKLFDLGRVTIPVGTILGSVAAAVLGDQVLNGALAGAAGAQTKLRAVKAEEATLTRLKDDAQAAQAEAARVVPGGPLAARFEQPVDQAVAHGAAPVRIRIDGANRTFVQPTLGVQPRVVVRVNGRTWRYDPAQWVERAGGIELEAVLVPVPDPPAQPPSIMWPPVVIERQTPVRVRFEDTGEQLRPVFVVPVEALPPSGPGPRGPAGLSPGPAPPGTTALRTGPRAASVAWRAPLAPAGGERVERLADPAVLASSPALARAERELRRAAADRGGPGDGQLRVVGATHATTWEPGPQLTGEAVAVQAEAEAVALGIDPSGALILGARPGLNAVQVAVADGKAQQAAAQVLVLIERDVPAVVIAEVTGGPAAFDPRGTGFVIRNDGGADVHLEGWILRVLAEHVFSFPAVTLAPGQVVVVWTGAGVDDDENLYWDLHEQLSGGRGQGVVLADAAGRELHRLDLETLWRPP